MKMGLIDALDFFLVHALGESVEISNIWNLKKWSNKFLIKNLWKFFFVELLMQIEVK